MAGELEVFRLKQKSGTDPEMRTCLKCWRNGKGAHEVAVEGVGGEVGGEARAVMKRPGDQSCTQSQSLTEAGI